MKWLQKLINYFRGKPVTLKSGKTVSRKAVDLTRLSNIENIAKTLKSQQGQSYLNSLSVNDLKLLKKQIADGTITSSELTNKMSIWTLRNSAEVKEFNKLLRNDPELKQSWDQSTTKFKMTVYRNLSKRVLSPEKAKNSIIKSGQTNPLDPLFAKINFKVVQGIKFSADEVSKINQFSDNIWADMKTGYWKVKNKSYQITILGKPETWHDVNLQQFVKNKQTYNKFKVDPAVLAKGQQTPKTVTVRVVSTFDAVNIYGMSSRTNGWANSKTNEVFMVYESFIPTYGNIDKLRSSHLNLNLNKDNFVNVVFHELAHIKDPSITRSLKLGRTYNSNAVAPVVTTPAEAQKLLSKSAPENWYKNYFFHFKERLANLAPVLAIMVSNTQKIVMKHGKKKTTDALNEISEWLSKGTPETYKFKNPLCEEILGFSNWYDMPKILRDLPLMNQSSWMQNLSKKFFKNPSAQPINVFFKDYKYFYPEGYKQVSNKIARQIEALKQQVRQTRTLTPESIMELKVIEI